LNILVIDTSTEIEFLALSVDGKIFQYCENAGMSHSVTMFQNLSSILSQAAITINDIDLIGAGIGPGSFTGIRIAVSTARMFSQILGIPLVGLMSQEIYAVSAGLSGDKTVLAAFDAKKSKVFGGVYSVRGSIACELVEPGDFTMNELLELIQNESEITCVGDGCGKYLDIISSSSLKKGINYTYLEDFFPDGRAAAELTLRRYNEKPGKYVDFNNTIPFYTRKSDAEIAKYDR
jgi:tRNA threonylcarbamoyladenosine biosynthesis protein TsaB